MDTTNRFSLERHQGEYESWPLRTRLYVDGIPTKTYVPGYSLLHEYQTLSGYLLITDNDCPFEEATSFILLSHDFRLLSYRTLSVPYGSFSLDSVERINDCRFWAVFYKNDYWLVTIRPWGIPFLRPRIMLRRVRDHYSNHDGKDSKVP